MPDVQLENQSLQTANNSWSGNWKFDRIRKKAGWKYLASSDGTAKDTSANAANDKWGTNADPATDAYPAFDSVSCWRVDQGPTTLKLLMNVAPTGGTLLKSEKVTQASTGAEGELVGWDMDGSKVATTVAAGSNGVNVNTFAGAGTLNVASTANYPSAGGYVNIPALGVTIQYTGVTATSFTGCTTLFSGAGVLATGQQVNGANGHAVILPRAAVGVTSFDGTHAITGAVSGASFTPVGLKTFVREMVTWKDTTINSGIVMFQCVCDEDEHAQRFSVLAANSSCTATIAPGGGSDASNNWFPQKSSTTIAAGSNGAALPQATINVASTQNAAGQPVFPSAGVIIVTTSNGPQFVTYTGFTGTTFTGCQGGSGTMSTGGAVAGTSTFGSFVCLGTNVNGSNTFASWFSQSTNLGKAQYLASNVVGSTGVSPDGTCVVAVGNISGAGCEFWGLHRCDDTEDGEIDPFLFHHGSNTGFSSANSQRTAASQTTNNNFTTITTSDSGAGSATSWRGNRRRGWVTQDPNTATPQTGDGFMAYYATMEGNIGGGTYAMGTHGTTVNEVVACSYAPVRLRERFKFMSVDPANKQRKGNARWLQFLTGNVCYDTFDGKLRMVVCSSAVSSNPAIVLGLFDGSTVPSQS